MLAAGFAGVTARARKVAGLLWIGTHGSSRPGTALHPSFSHPGRNPRRSEHQAVPQRLAITAVTIGEAGGVPAIVSASQRDRQRPPGLDKTAFDAVIVTFALWASGTWWILLLTVLGLWRHLRRRWPLTYEPTP